jgi:non-ribosomal peptide synthetase component E (peptide arylation enzyme)
MVAGMTPDAATDAAGPSTTLDDLFRRAGVRRHAALALADPPNRAQFTDGKPRRLTYAQADRVISAIAGRLRGLGLPTDAVVALQLPNTVEGILSLIGVLRAGMIPAPLPLHWHQRDAGAALRGIGARAITTCARVGETPQAEVAVQVAADLFSIRHVLAFGVKLPDGVAPLDDVFSAEPESGGAVARLADPAAHIAAVTFDVTANGIVPLARNHWQLITGGLAICHEARIGEDANLLSTIPPSSFAGLALSVLPWLMSGGTLTLHHAFDAAAFATQTRAQHFDAAVVPGPALPALAAGGVLDATTDVIALWRSAERMQRTAPCARRQAAIDVASFGEIGIVATRRSGDLPAPLAGGVIAVPQPGADAVLIETARGPAGTLLLRGPMVPATGFPFGAKPHPAMTPAGFIDSGEPCRFAADGNALLVTGPPPGIASVGFYRFPACELGRLAESLGADVTLMTVPQEMTGERLAAQTNQRGQAVRKLRELGANPLIVEAFCRRPAA